MEYIVTASKDNKVLRAQATKDIELFMINAFMSETNDYTIKAMELNRELIDNGAACFKLKNGLEFNITIAGVKL